MAQQRWWYKPDGSIVGFLDVDHTWFFTSGGKQIGYINNGWIYTPSGSAIGYFDADQNNIFSQNGEHLGFLEP